MGLTDIEIEVAKYQLNFEFNIQKGNVLYRDSYEIRPNCKSTPRGIVAIDGNLEALIRRENNLPSKHPTIHLKHEI